MPPNRKKRHVLLDKQKIEQKNAIPLVVLCPRQLCMQVLIRGPVPPRSRNRNFIDRLFGRILHRILFLFCNESGSYLKICMTAGFQSQACASKEQEEPASPAVVEPPSSRRLSLSAKPLQREALEDEMSGSKSASRWRWLTALV